MDWKIGEAKQKFSEVVHAAQKGPQIIYNRKKMVAIVLDSENYKDFLRFKKSKNAVASEFEKLRELCAEEGYQLKTPRRKNRKARL
ncbi:MAG: type II toxin-antitoxin system Phd/YefM family antitoxin [Nitrospinae bacterium]|nr:type II toxin-antitoxin system Phd/YefM family antitoxin [Nitrospinota bacterium]